MSGIFLKFKRRRNAIRVARASMIGVALGLASSGLWLILYKLAVINFEPITALFIALGVALVSGGLVFILTGKSDKAFAEELDSAFDLKARVQTMVEYRGEDGDMISIQREDAERALSQIPVRSYKFKRLWIYITALVLSVIPFTVGIALADSRDYTPPEEVIPFELSNLQRTGLNELIAYVESSDMEEEYKTQIADELRDLLAELEIIKTKPEMIVAVSESMSVICDITYESSTATEVMNALWDSDDVYFRHLAKSLNMSHLNAPEWGDFAENIMDYAGVLMGDDKDGDSNSSEPVSHKENLKFALDTMTRKLKTTLDEAGVGEDDEICVAINRLFYGNPGGFAPLLASIDYIDEADARANLLLCFEFNSENLYNAMSLNKINAGVGEHAMMRLASLFGVSTPEFERPEFVKNGETVGGGNIGDDEKDNNTESDGGIGDGATFGSNDIVIDPFTGEPTEYGELFAKYYGTMFERLEGDSYTEEQKEAIRKYFDLLYGKTQKEEGN